MQIMKVMIELILFLGLTLPLIGSVRAQNLTNSPSVKIISSAFSEGGKIPKKYTCDDSNISPPLHIDGVPATAKSVALIVDDPDAPGRTWNHWLVWNIDPRAKDIRENSVPHDAVQGTTDFGSPKYGGPCPPSGVHRYYFYVYALDTKLSLPGSTTRGALEKAMAGHIVGKGSLMGTYSRGH